jgi:Xaa-Pro aminopeptidase
MEIRYDRIERAQGLMKAQGMIGIMIMNHDDYRYFFGEARVQPRAIIPATGDPVFIGFAGEEAELKEANENKPIKSFTHVGEQIFSVRQVFKGISDGPPPGIQLPPSGRPKVGMQLWFHTPAFLVDLFRKVNPQVDLVPSDPVMDELRMVKEPEELECMKKAQSIAAMGMDRVRAMLRPEATGHEIATEVLYTMMKAGAEGTSTPMHINSGLQSCWVHGRVDRKPIEAGELVVVDLTPQFQGYCANLTRTFILGEPQEWQARLLTTYEKMHEATRDGLRPGSTVAALDKLGKSICESADLEDFHINGISHGIGLRFEETPASTIIPPHKSVKLKEGMTMTVGHTILAIPGKGGARFEDVYAVTPSGGRALHAYPFEWEAPI